MNFIQFTIGLIFIIGLAFLTSKVDWKKETADLVKLFRKGVKDA